MATIDARDLRQLRKMDERLQMYQDGRISLRVLIADLEFLLGAFEEIDETVRLDLREVWTVLEEVYAVALDGKVDREGDVLVRGAVSDLRDRVGRLVAPRA
jgi:hypothetical protein